MEGELILESLTTHFMKTILSRIILYTGLGLIIFMFYKSRTSEDLVTESIPVSTLDFDEKIAKIPFETATFGMG